MAEKATETGWMWMDKRAGLLLWTGARTRQECDACVTNTVMRKNGKPVRVRITPIAGKKKGTVKR